MEMMGLRLPAELLEQVQAVAGHYRVSDWIRQAILEKLERDRDPAPQA